MLKDFGIFLKGRGTTSLGIQKPNFVQNSNVYYLLFIF